MEHQPRELVLRQGLIKGRRRCPGPRAQMEKGPRSREGPSLSKYPGDVLLSQGVSPQVPSALAGLTAVFGMGTGVAPPPWSPETLLLSETQTVGLAEVKRPSGHPLSVP